MMIFASPKHVSGAAMEASELNEVAKCAEVGSHTLRHTPIDDCSPTEAREHVRSGRQHLEQVLGKPVPHFCLVGGRFNRANLEAVSELVNSVRSTDLLNFGAPKQGGLIRPSLQIRFRGRTHPAKVIWAALSRLSTARALLVSQLVMKGARQHDLMSHIARLWTAPEIYLHLWGHSADVERCGAWGELEGLFRTLALIDAVPMNYSSFIACAPGDTLLARKANQ
jgi:hypothetical protein